MSASFNLGMGSVLLPLLILFVVLIASAIRILREYERDEMLSERERLNVDIQRILDAQTDGWGIKVTTVEIKHIDLNESMVRAIARQAEAERERRAKVIHAEGEKQAAAALLEAAQM